MYGKVWGKGNFCNWMITIISQPLSGPVSLGTELYYCFLPLTTLKTGSLESVRTRTDLCTWRHLIPDSVDRCEKKVELSIMVLGHWVYECLMAAIANYHKHGGLKQEKFITHHVWPGRIPSEGSRGQFFLSSCRLYWSQVFFG